MLPDQSLLETKAQNTPADFASLVISQGPISYWKRGEFWLVSDYKLAEEILKNPLFSADRSSFFISRMPNMDLSLITDFFGVVSKMMVMSDADEHLRRRKIATIALNEELLNLHIPKIKTLIDTLLENAEQNGSIEFVKNVIEILPSTILAEIFNIPESDRSQFYSWSNNMTQFFGGASQYRNEDGIEVNESATRLRQYIEKLVKLRKQKPENDFLSLLLKSQNDFKLSDDEIVSQAIMMLVAGQVTTTDQICNNLFSLLTIPGAYAAINEDRGLIKTAIEEFNRLDPAVTFLFRVAKENTAIGNIEITKGSVVFISNHAVNRDPNIYSNPNECILQRSYNPHFAYGNGSHFCMGAKLARMQMNLLFEKLFKKYEHLQLCDSNLSKRKHHSLAFSGFEYLNVKVSKRKKAPFHNRKEAFQELSIKSRN